VIAVADTPEMTDLLRWEISVFMVFLLRIGLLVDPGTSVIPRPVFFCQEPDRRTNEAGIGRRKETAVGLRISPSGAAR